MLSSLINGEVQDSVSVQDRGFQYGDGLFETLRVIDGKPCHWSRHLRRLQKGCSRLGIPCPESTTLQAEAKSLCAGIDVAVLKITLTRGKGKRGYAVPEKVEATRVLGIAPLPSYPLTHKTEGIVLTVCKTRMGINPALAGIKHLNRLEQVMARTEWQDAGISEGLMLDNNGFVIAGTMSNVFAVRNGELLTPDLSHCGVKGITRERLMEATTDSGFPVLVKPLTLDEIKQADELFVCNSVIGIWPVRQLQEKSWQPGPLTQRLIPIAEASCG